MRRRNKRKRRKGDANMMMVKEIRKAGSRMSSYEPAKTKEVVKVLTQYNEKHDDMMKKLAKL